MSKTDPVSRETVLHVRDMCLCLHVQRAARALARRFDEAFRPVGLTHGQFSLLMSLGRPSPPGIGEVAAVLAMDRTTLTAALKPLGRRGLVKIQPNPDDRRGRVLILTRAGRELLSRAVPIWQQTHEEVDQLIPEPGPDRLRAALNALLESGREASNPEMSAATAATDQEAPR